MDTNEESSLIAQLKRHEGLELKPYKDSEGVLTIGYGTNLDEGLDEDEATYLLTNRMIKAAQALSKALPWTDKLDPVRQAALVNMTYNMGVARLLGFKNFLAAVQTQRWVDAAAEGLKSKWTTQVGERAKELMEQIRTGQWQ